GRDPVEVVGERARRDEAHVACRGLPVNPGDGVAHALFPDELAERVARRGQAEALERDEQGQVFFGNAVAELVPDVDVVVFGTRSHVRGGRGMGQAPIKMFQCPTSSPANFSSSIRTPVSMFRAWPLWVKFAEVMKAVRSSTTTHLEWSRIRLRPGGTGSTVRGS